MHREIARRAILCSLLVTICLSGSIRTTSAADPICESDFSKGTLTQLGWVAKGEWDTFTYPDVQNNPGALARFSANKPDGTLTKSFAEITNPKRLRLTLNYGWGWGDAGQPADGVSWMLLDPRGNGYIFEVHRVKATWAVQWANVSNGVAPNDKHWASEEIDATHKAVRDGGGLSSISIVRESDGRWAFSSPDWNQGAGGQVSFTDTTTGSFSQIVLLGTRNFDDQLFNKIVLDLPPVAPTTAIPVTDFLDSIGVVTTFPDRGQPLDKTIEMIKYGGFRWVRGGIEGVTSDGPTTMQTFLDLHKQTDVRISWGLVSGGTDVRRLIQTARQLAAANALLAIEGNNEPNNWGVTYQGEQGGGRAPSWMAVAKLQRDLYEAIKNDPILKNYPVWSISENGAAVDNVGLQFLTIPKGARTLLPEGTRFADFANVHNYIYHPNSAGLDDNKTWNAADPTPACKIDGLFGNYGTTWAKHFHGYSSTELLTLPRVTTETGCTIGGPVTEEIQALNLLSMYLDQFKRGWKHTAVYLLRDRTDEADNQTFGFFKPDYSPRKASLYLHALTFILQDRGRPSAPDQLSYSIPAQPSTVHDLLLQKSDGTFALVVWGEKLQGSDDVTVELGRKASSVRVCDPTRGTEAVRSLNDVESVRLTLSNHPFILEVSAN